MLNIKAITLTLALIPVALSGLFFGLLTNLVKGILFIPTDTYDMVVDMLNQKDSANKDHPFNK